MNSDEGALIGQILAAGQSPGDRMLAASARQAFALLVQKYQGLVLSVIFSMVKNEETARDLTQETFLKAFRALKQFDRNRSFKAWLLKIANNNVVDYLRSSKNKEEVSLELIIEEEPGLEPFDDNDPGELADRTMFLEKLATALQLLPLRYRQAFVLRYQFDLPYDDIAEVMQENENTVRTLLHRAKERLRKLLTDEKTEKKA